MGRTAVVVGGGIGGLSAALGLCRAGWDVEVRERRDDPTAEGAGLSLWPNALRALDVLGAGDAVRDMGLIQAAGGIRDRRGRWILRTDNRVVAARHGDGITVVARAALLRSLRDALPPGTLRTGDEVTAEELADPRALGADLLVGADGIGSRVRAVVAPAARPRSTGTVAWRLAVDVEDPPDEGGETWGDGCYAGVAPLRGTSGEHSEGRVNLWVVVDADEPAASDVDALRERFAGFHDPIPRLLDRADPATALITELSWLPPLRTLVADRTVLLGDAGHAMTPNLGQGACLAIEDAAVLSRCLAVDAPEPALARYDALRRPRVARLTRMSRLAGRVAGLSGRVPTAVRDAVGRATPSAVSLRNLDGVLGWRPPEPATSGPSTGA